MLVLGGSCGAEPRFKVNTGGLFVVAIRLFILSLALITDGADLVTQPADCCSWGEIKVSEGNSEGDVYWGGVEADDSWLALDVWCTKTSWVVIERL